MKAEVSVRPHPSDMARLNRDMNRLAESTGKTVKEVLPSQMRLLAADLAFVTTPKGKGSKDNAEHMEKIRWRIYQIYPHVGQIVKEIERRNPGAAGRFASLVSKRNYNGAQAIARQFLGHVDVGAFDGGQLHRAQKNQRKVTRRLCVPGYTRVTSYANKTARKSGFAKGGYATGARMLGGVRGIPGFATRQRSPGRGSVTGDGRTLSVTLQNDVNYIRKAIKPSDEAAALNHRSKQVGKVLKRIQDRKVRQIMRQSR